MSKTRIGRILFRLAWISLLVGIAFALLAWWRLPDILNGAARRILPKLGLEQAEINVVRANGHELVIEAGQAKGEGWQATFDTLTVTYSLSELWKYHRAESVTLSGVSIAVDPARLASLADAESAPSEPALKIDPSLFGYVPSNGVSIRDARFSLLNAEQSVDFLWSAHAERVGDDQVKAVASAETEGGTLDLEGTLRADGEANLQVHSKLQDPLAFLDTVYSPWRQLADLPEELSFSIGESSQEIAVKLANDGSALLTLSLNANDLDARYETASVDLNSIFASAQIEYPSFKTFGTITLNLKQASYDDVLLGSQILSIPIASEDLASWKLNCREPISWDYDESTVKGATTFVLTAKLNDGSDSGPTFQTDLLFSQLSVLDQELAPFSASAEGTLDTIHFNASVLQSREWPSLQIADSSATIRLVEDPYEMRIHYVGSLVTNALRDLQPDLSSTPLSIELDVVIDDFSETIDLALKTNEPTQIAAVEGQATLRGNLELTLHATTDAEAIVWSGTTKLNASDLNAAGPDWKLSEAGAESVFTFSNLDSDVLAADDITLDQMLDHVLGSVSGRLDWQANEATAPDALAQWLSGSIELNTARESDAPRIQASATTYVGIAKAHGETLQQISFESNTCGGLEALDTQGRFSLRFEGQEAAIDYSHSVQDWLTSDPSLRGQYSFAPFLFDYSDLLSRNVTALQGISISGSLSANGAYWLDAAGPDASVDLRFNDGAVDYPAQTVSVEGIETRLVLASLTHVVSQPGMSTVDVATIKLGDIVASDAVLAFDILSAERIQALDIHLTVFGGQVSFEPAIIDLSKTDYEGRLVFDHLSLSEITKQISFFQGEMEGAISGYLPLSYKDGVFRPGEGRMHIPEGETAHLSYRAEGLFPPPTPAPNGKVPLGDRILKLLKLEPEPLVESALANVSISSLNVELLPKGAPLTPIRIHLSGTAKAGDISLPINIQTNVNGTINELIDFLIRLNSLGSASF